MNFDFDSLSDADECRGLSSALASFFDSKDTYKTLATLLQNLEALLMVMQDKRSAPDGDDFSNAMDMIATVALKLKYGLLCSMAVRLCLGNDFGYKQRGEAIESSLKIIRRMRAWTLRHPF